MTKRILAGVALGAWMGFASMAAVADEASGKVVDTGFGAFKLESGKETRQFNLSSSKSQYEPTSWRPTKDDEIKVAFTPTKRGTGEVLAVDKVTLVKAGPDTVASLPSPLIVEITEAGRSGIRAKLPGGQIIRLGYQRSTQRTPSDWAPVVGEKAKIEAHVQPTLIFTVTYLIDKMERVGDAPAAKPATK